MKHQLTKEEQAPIYLKKDPSEKRINQQRVLATWSPPEMVRLDQQNIATGTTGGPEATNGIWQHGSGS